MENKKILICDDSKFMRMMLKDIIENMGVLKSNIFEAEDGKVGVEKYNEIKPDAMLMDITMPVMDGILAMKQILKENSQAKIVILSAMGQQENVKEALENGAKDFVVKPFKRETIEDVIKKVVNEE